MTIRALVPLKRLTEAKSRLAAFLSPAERQSLVLQMASHVLNILRNSVSETVLLTMDYLHEFSGIPQLIDAGEGLNAALSHARRIMPHQPGDILLVVAGDLPLLDGEDVAEMLQACKTGIGIAMDRHGLGTNAIALPHALDFQFCYGPDSLSLHEAEGRRLGVAPTILNRRGLATDVDDKESLRLTKLYYSPI